MSDSCHSITIYQTGTTLGKNGPTTFIMTGKWRKEAYTDALLVEHRCEPGPTIAIAENAYMTDEAWVGITKLVVDGYQKIPLIRENSQHWMLELFDGFGSHTKNIEAMEVRFSLNRIAAQILLCLSNLFFLQYR